VCVCVCVYVSERESVSLVNSVICVKEVIGEVEVEVEVDDERRLRT
jgi:hypothetical protein